MVFTHLKRKPRETNDSDAEHLQSDQCAWVAELTFPKPVKGEAVQTALCGLSEAMGDDHDIAVRDTICRLKAAADEFPRINIEGAIVSVAFPIPSDLPDKKAEKVKNVTIFDLAN